MTTMYIHMLYTYAQTLFTSAPPHRMMLSSICLAVCEFLWAFGYTPEGFVTFLSTTSSPYFELISVCYLIGTCYWFLFSFSISLLLFFLVVHKQLHCRVLDGVSCSCSACSIEILPISSIDELIGRRTLRYDMMRYATTQLFLYPTTVIVNEDTVW